MTPFRCTLAAAALLAGCEPDPPEPSGSLLVPYQFVLEYSIEEDPGHDTIARARLYDVAQIYDVFGNAGTIELTDGDAVFADGIELDIETRSEVLGTLRVDYSQTVPDAAEHDFELRRPHDERIEATIPAPDPFDVAEIGDVAWPDLDTTLSWTPVLPGATIDITIEPKTDFCPQAFVFDSRIVTALDDTGEYRFYTDDWHSTDQDCTYELTLTRRFVQQVHGTWHVHDQDVPSTDAWAIGLMTTRRTFVALKKF